MHIAGWKFEIAWTLDNLVKLNGSKKTGTGNTCRYRNVNLDACISVSPEITCNNTFCTTVPNKQHKVAGNDLHMPKEHLTGNAILRCQKQYCAIQNT